MGRFLSNDGTRWKKIIFVEVIEVIVLYLLSYKTVLRHIANLSFLMNNLLHTAFIV